MRSFAGTLGTRIWQAPARDPETKGVVERANGFLQTSFMPGRTFTGPADFNGQLAEWLPKANERLVRSTGATPSALRGQDVAAMAVLPPVAPRCGLTLQVRLGRDYYVRVAGNDYSVDPQVIGRMVDITCGLDRVTVVCAGQTVADHERSWARGQTFTDPAHVATAKQLRRLFQERPRRAGPSTEPTEPGGTGGACGSRDIPRDIPREVVVARRSLAHYDVTFGLGSPPGAAPSGAAPSGAAPSGAAPVLTLVRS